MRVLIIGGTGLISTAITRQLLERGDEVTLFNRGRTPQRIPSGAMQMVGDRTDFAAFEGQLAGAGPFDCAIDMVCYRPAEAESAVRALRGRTGHYIFCSTVDVYARPVPRYPIGEDAPLGGVSAYGKDKARCEAILQAAHERGDLVVTSLRPAQTYGDTGGLVHPLGWKTTYFDRIKKGKPVVVHGDGSSLWVACNVEDVARAFVGAAANAATFGRAYNVTGEEWLTWNDYVGALAAAMDAPPPEVVHIPTDLLARVAPDRATVTAENFRFNNIFDTSAARRDLGFRYTIPFVAGARRTLAAFAAAGRILNSDDDPFDDQLIANWRRVTMMLDA